MILGAWRSARRLLAFTLLTAWYAARSAFAPRRRPEIMTLWARALARAFGVRLTVTGTPPSAPCLLVANHLGYVDILLLSASVPCTFVAKAEIASWPVLGTVCRLGDTVFLDRETRRDIGRVIATLERHLEAGRIVAFFPEGTTSDGSGVRPFGPSLLEVAARNGTPVCGAAIACRTPDGSPPASRAVSWVGDDTFLPHLARFLTLPRVEARVSFAPERLTGTDRKDLAARLHEVVVREHRRIV